MIKHILQIQFVLEWQWISRLAFSPMQLDFESAPFSHLGTSPKTPLLYQHKSRKSRIFRKAVLSFCQFQNRTQPGKDPVIVFRLMRYPAFAAVLNAGSCIAEVSAATVPQCIQRAIAEQAVKGLHICTGVAGKPAAGFILIKFIAFHSHFSMI